jgi:hypothetical protein
VSVLISVLRVMVRAVGGVVGGVGLVDNKGSEMKLQPT